MRRSDAIKQGFVTSLQVLLLLRTALDVQLQMLTLKTTNGKENGESLQDEKDHSINPHTVAEAALSALEAARKEKDNDE